MICGRPSARRRLFSSRQTRLNSDGSTSSSASPSSSRSASAASMSRGCPRLSPPATKRTTWRPTSGVMRRPPGLSDRFQRPRAVHAGQAHPVLGDRRHRLPQALQVRQIVLPQADERPVVADRRRRIAWPVPGSASRRRSSASGARFSTRSASSVRKSRGPGAGLRRSRGRSRTAPRTGRTPAPGEPAGRRTFPGASCADGNAPRAYRRRPAPAASRLAAGVEDGAGGGGFHLLGERRRGRPRDRGEWRPASIPRPAGAGTAPPARARTCPVPIGRRAPSGSFVPTRRSSSSASSARPWKKLLKVLREGDQARPGILRVDAGGRRRLGGWRRGFIGGSPFLRWSFDASVTSR